MPETTACALESPRPGDQHTHSTSKGSRGNPGFVWQGQVADGGLNRHSDPIPPRGRIPLLSVVWQHEVVAQFHRVPRPGDEVIDVRRGWRERSPATEAPAVLDIGQRQQQRDLVRRHEQPLVKLCYAVCLAFLPRPTVIPFPYMGLRFNPNRQLQYKSPLRQCPGTGRLPDPPELSSRSTAETALEINH
jgi:hypothetical protein